MDKIVFATSNKNKLREAKSILEDLPYKFIGLDSFSNIPPILETGKTLLENSLIKAKTVFDITGLPSIGDDTGLEVEYLNGSPGVMSARYAGESASSQDNINKLLLDMNGVHVSECKARFRTVISFITDSDEQWVEGTVDGIIIDKPQGSGGFGYDSIFFIPKLNKTFAELSMEEKNKISHRGLALEKFRILLGNFDLA